MSNPFLFENEKYYYTISEVAKALGVSTSQIRFWEKEFSFINPQKNKRGDRRFVKKDIDDLQLVVHLLKEKKFTIKGAKEYLKNQKNALERELKVIEHLENAKKRLENLSKYL
jgi:DNA-binding transcriptional MerR regulator